MSKLLIVANWKCNPQTLIEAENLFNSIKQGVKNVKGIEVVICPPFVYLFPLRGISRHKDLPRGGRETNFMKLGAQNCFYEQKGAYTGEVSPAMLKDMGCEYVIIGHSERKKYFGENNDIINKKVKAALNSGLKVILCIGEDTRDSFDQKGRWTHELDPKVKEQLVGALRDVRKSKLANIIVAYEPVWAIGTGNPAIPDDILSAKIFIRKILSDLYTRKEADEVRVLYGGSTNKKNAVDFITDGQADGLLVGGASLDAEEFIAIIRSINNANS
jgi:triosephosphate isomerase